MYKIAVIGDKSSVSGFAALGLDVFATDDAQQALRTLRHLADNDCAVIYITELLASQLEEELTRYDSRPLPAIIPIPGINGNTGLGLRNVSRSVEKAVGSDIIS